MSGTHLTGLEGTNPLAFLAALGVQVLFEADPDQPRLWWSDDVIPHAVVDESFTIDQIAEKAVDRFSRWRTSHALATKLPGAADMKFPAEHLRTYLSETRADAVGDRLAWCVVSEGSLATRDKKGQKEEVAKPTDLYFTAGQQPFGDIMREIFENTTFDDVANALVGPWSYKSKLPTLMWDVVDDANYALAARNPSKEKKLTNPGAEALAILGFSLYPVFTGQDRTLTTGCRGSWKRGDFSWPLWSHPGSLMSTRSLVSHVGDEGKRPSQSQDLREKRYAGWCIYQVYRSAIRRSDQGGYGTFGPPEIVWQRS